MIATEMGARRAMRVLILSDGIPGHVNQSRGLARWLEERWGVQVEEVVIGLRHRTLVQLLGPHLLRFGKPGQRSILGQYSGLPNGPDADLIISAGGRTSFANAALASLLGKPNIFIGSLRHLPPDAFKARLALEPGRDRDAIVLELPPTNISAAAMETAGQALMQSHPLAERQNFHATLIGGNGTGFEYQQDDWKKLAHLLTRTAKRDGAQLLVATSRRTGSQAEQILRENLPSELIADAVWWSEEQRPTTNAYLALASAVTVTGESMTMITEAISSGKPTTALMPGKRPENKRYDDALARFEARGYLKICKLTEDECSWPDGAPDMKALADDIVQRLAARLDLKHI